MALSVINFRLNQGKVWEQISFTGNGMKLLELKREVLDRKKMSATMDFDLRVVDDNDNEYVEDDEIVPKNASVIVKRIPARNQSTSLMVRLSRGGAPLGSAISQQKADIHVPIKEEEPEVDETKPETLSQLVLDEEPAVLKRTQPVASSNAWDSAANSQFSQYGPGQSAGAGRGGGFVGRPGGATNFVCYRCGQSGHSIKLCPTIGDPKFDTEIRLMNVPKASRRKVSTLEGVNVANKTVVENKDGTYEIFESSQLNLDKLTREGDTSFSSNTIDMAEVPDHLKCGIDGSFLREAVTLPCCRKSVNDSVARQKLLESGLQCPICGTPSVSPDSLMTRQDLRNAVESFLKNKGLDPATVNKPQGQVYIGASGGPYMNGMPPHAQAPMMPMMNGVSPHPPGVPGQPSAMPIPPYASTMPPHAGMPFHGGAPPAVAGPVSSSGAPKPPPPPGPPPPSASASAVAAVAAPPPQQQLLHQIPIVSTPVAPTVIDPSTYVPPIDALPKPHSKEEFLVEQNIQRELKALAEKKPQDRMVNANNFGYQGNRGGRGGRGGGQFDRGGGGGYGYRGGGRGGRGYGYSSYGRGDRGAVENYGYRTDENAVDTEFNRHRRDDDNNDRPPRDRDRDSRDDRDRRSNGRHQSQERDRYRGRDSPREGRSGRDGSRRSASRSRSPYESRGNKELSRDWDREKDKERDRDRGDRERDKERDRDKGDRDRERERDREKDIGRSRPSRDDSRDRGTSNKREKSLHDPRDDPKRGERDAEKTKNNDNCRDPRERNRDGSDAAPRGRSHNRDKARDSRDRGEVEGRERDRDRGRGKDDSSKGSSRRRDKRWVDEVDSRGDRISHDRSESKPSRKSQKRDDSRERGSGSRKRNREDEAAEKDAGRPNGKAKQQRQQSEQRIVFQESERDKKSGGGGRRRGGRK